MFLRKYRQVLGVFAFCSILLLFLFYIAPNMLAVKRDEASLATCKEVQRAATLLAMKESEQLGLTTLKQLEPASNSLASKEEQFIFTTNDQFELRATEMPSLSEKLKELLQCCDNKLIFEKIQYGSYWLIRNLIIGEKSKNAKCAETITYTTNGDYTFLENLPVVLKSWMAPVSFALYTPGFDLNKTMESIQYLRHCIPESGLIRDFATFHIYFPNKHMPPYVPFDENEAATWNYTCDTSPPYLNVNRSELYKTKANLTYPINVGRNIARKAANTYFIFACDIELIPSPGLVPKFLKMISNDISILYGNNGLRVFPLPVFEIQKNAKIPSTKTELKKMLAKKTAIPFHALLCQYCHLVPNQTHWLNTRDEDQLSITAVGKRQGEFRYWEPFYISNNMEPVFDERVTWEGRSNKRIQNFAMCLLGYEYLILHPVFLTHMPGIKHFDRSRMLHVPAMNRIIKNKIEPEYRILYGHNSKCVT